MTVKRSNLAVAASIGALLALVLASVAGANHSVTDRVSFGPAGGNGDAAFGFDVRSQGISQDGTHVFFQTSEGLVSADTDGCQDVYERVGGTTTLVSTGLPGPPWVPGFCSDLNAGFSGASADGTHVFFTTRERFTTTPNHPADNEDTDNELDVYERSGGTTTLITRVGTSVPNGPYAVNFIRASQDGSRVFFHTSEGLGGDSDGLDDIYEYSGGINTRVSTGPTGGNAVPPVGGVPTLDAISADGTRAFFHTVEPLVASDTDSTTDIFERSAGTTTLLSTGTGGTGGNGPHAATFAGASADGSRVFFKTNESLVNNDTDLCGSGPCQDVYDRTSGMTTLVSTGPAGGNGSFDAEFGAASQDGARAVFTTPEPMVGTDTDNQSDVYERSGGTTTQISIGPNGGNGAGSATVVGVSADGARVFFTTTESLVASDTDSTADIYERASGTTTLVSTGPGGGNGTFAATFAASSGDGSRIFFNTSEAQVSTDTDGGASDIYERSGGTTTLVSAGPANPQGTVDATFERISQDGTRVAFSTTEKLVSSDTDSRADVYVASTGVTTGFPRPKSATPMFVPLVPVYEQCASGNTTHGAPFAFESCNPPVPTSRYLTVGTPDANGQVANSVGSARLNVLLGDPSTPADEADIAIAFSLTDVRKQSDNSDYAGELRAMTSLRITDKANGASQTLPGTVADMPFGFTVPCTTTVSSTTGGTCTLNSTLDALVGGGPVKESKRSIFKLVGDVEVYDGGADGVAATSGDNTLFAGSGLFVP